MVVLSEYRNVVLFSELDCKVLRAFLVDGNSYRDIERKILGLDAPVRGGGFAVMNILHKKGEIKTPSKPQHFANITDSIILVKPPITCSSLPIWKS